MSHDVYCYSFFRASPYTPSLVNLSQPTALPCHPQHTYRSPTLLFTLFPPHIPTTQIYYFHQLFPLLHCPPIHTDPLLISPQYISFTSPLRHLTPSPPPSLPCSPLLPSSPCQPSLYHHIQFKPVPIIPPFLSRAQFRNLHGTLHLIMPAINCHLVGKGFLISRRDDGAA